VTPPGRWRVAWVYIGKRAERQHSAARELRPERLQLLRREPGAAPVGVVLQREPAVVGGGGDGDLLAVHQQRDPVAVEGLELVAAALALEDDRAVGEDRVRGGVAAVSDGVGAGPKL
jgi:hypothetical protein